MGKITKKDIDSFARVLKELRRIIESEPDAILDFFEKKSDIGNGATAKPAAQTGYSSRVQEADLYAYAKQHTEEQLIAFLRSFSVVELKEFVKRYNLGYTKLKAVDSIAQYIAEHMKKRTVDVFMRHEK